VTVLAHTAEFQHYVQVRDAVLRMKAAGAPTGTSDPSAYWSEELENIDYLVEASPLIIRKLRHHAFHITGIRPYDYRVKADTRRRTLFEARLRALRELDGGRLLVPESPALGGFGYDIEGQLFNVDTIKFYEVLIGMERGGLLDELRPKERPVVCEIGAGWGGFAYQFRTLLPRTTYVIVDFPELFLFSATYLGVVCPGARLLLAEGGALDGWKDADFVFVPHTHAGTVAQLPLDLTVNMASFQEMTDAQVRAYADIAARARCPYLYSFNRERSPYHTELLRVSDALSDAYQLTEIPVLPTDYTSAMKKPPKAQATAERSEFAYRHLFGRLRGVTQRQAGEAVVDTAQRPEGPRVVLGMTLYNNAPALGTALKSLLGQTYDDFLLVLLDDASTDDTEAVARAYAARDSRVRYFRHDRRRAMIETWRHVFEIATKECPSASLFAWVSDHDRWHPRWLERLVLELDADPGAVLAYPITRRFEPTGEEIQKGARLFDTAACADLQARWRHFCREGVGAGDMAYGLIRIDALRRAGVFRTVLRPDRLLIAELTLLGRIRQVPEILWFRRQSATSSVNRQRDTLVVCGEEPRWFFWPPWLQHSIVLWREYVERQPAPLPITRAEWRRMLLRYQTTYGWRHYRKSTLSHAYGRWISHVILAKKRVKHHYHHAVYNVLVGGRRWWGLSRRAGRRALYHVLVFTHRIGIRGGGETAP
jgi:glycosyltransferase involved in cell wall biosynthesis